MTSYCPHTHDEVRQMLDAIGVKRIEDLFSEIPEEFQFKRDLNLPDGLSEAELVRKISDLAARNTTADDAVCFMGGGAYDHLIPAAIKHLLLRGDFFTAYTPYQPEVSQGTLQAIYEYQSMMCELTGMDVANASMYEGATALAEAANMAFLQTGRKKIVLAETVHPEYREVTKNLASHLNIQVVEIPFENGVTDLNKLTGALDDNTAAVLVQYPNFFGGIEDLETICAAAKKVGALSVVSAYPVALGLLTPPGAFGADIVCGEGQSLGIPMGFGGPYLGYIATRDQLLRKIPGRLCGKTLDKQGRTGFVLTLQAREQHIRREKATSNICSNQALMALNATIYLALLGKEGLKDVAHQSFQKAHYLQKELGKVPGIGSPFTSPVFNEFVVTVPQARKVWKKLADKGMLCGLPLEDWYPQLKNHLLIAVTEKRTREEMDLLTHLLGGTL